MAQKLKQPKPPRKRRSKKVEPVHPNDNLCPACRKRGVLSLMEPVSISPGMLSSIKWNCRVCHRAYDAKLKERGTIKPWEKK